ncbi:MAG: glutamine--tRNA ligase, partial [Candidatus Omnitrophica bacterium]|nr:glutamine--tRNA ligase [Candidatus Omnitrophota bacterium]
FTANLNPNSLEALSSCKIEPALAGISAGSRCQFERMGYFCVDSVDPQSGKRVFNRIVTLRDTWAKIQNKMK